MRLSAKSVRARLLVGASAAVLAMSCGAALAQEREPITIAPQSLTSALQEFGSKTSRQVMFTPGLIATKTSAGVSSATDEQMALAQLLQGTGLGFRREGDVYLIVKADAGPQSSGAAGDGAEVEALIVTAQKREEDIQDVPIAISAFSQEDLTRSQIAGGPDLITQVPNMTFTKTNFSSYSIQLRGIGTQAISATTDPAVAVAFNNTPFIRNRFFEQEFYDLQRVEVLRGPQGTLYGRNATAGVVNIISQKPKFVVESKLSGDIGNFSSSRLEAMVNIPLVEDKVALRLAGAWTKRDGYATNQLTGNPIDGRDLWSTRLSLRVTPTDLIDVNLIWEHFEEDDDRLRSGKQLCTKDQLTSVGGFPVGPESTWMNPANSLLFSRVQGTLSQGCRRGSLYSEDAFQTPNGAMLPYYLPLGSIGLPVALDDPYLSKVQSQDLRVIESTIDPDYRAKADLGELQVSIDLTDTLTLTSETAYGVDGVYSLQDFNRFNTAPSAWLQPNSELREGVIQPGPDGGIFCDPQLGCSDRLVAVDISRAESSQFSQELRLSSNFEGKFNFSLGANFLRADSEDRYYVFINSISMIAANGNPFFVLPPWSQRDDNSGCLDNGYAPGDPGIGYSVVGCVYLDPNPIGALNDKGHNYFLSKNPYKLISYAVFGEAYYNITDNLKVTAGLRWTVDKKEAPRVPTWLLASNSVGYPVAEVIEQEWREPTGRLTVDWKPDLGFTDETLLYASYAHGYKAGGANPPGFVRVFYSDASVVSGSIAASETRPRTFAPEFVDAFELGSKNVLLDGRLTANLAAFYYDYKDYQISEIVDRSAFNRNFDATVWGIELEADWRPLENLRFGIKGGYEKTSIADGERAIDLMDRTAGDPSWLVVRPFPVYASSCILPTEMIVRSDGLYRIGNVGGGGSGGCELAYVKGVDPVTGQPYQPVNITGDGFTAENPYTGFNPATAPNGGEGILKDLSGNVLPNAPEWTGTITAGYTIPLPDEWLATLHTDLHWQAESWWRVFQDHEYGKLDEYFTMNLAAIFTNEERGWNIMAYIKNVTDEVAITGAFLNSDDTGLTTNVFLTEPRLYGLRVTKAWTGGPLLGSVGQLRDGPAPFSVEIGGQVQRHDSPTSALRPSFTEAFTGPLDIFDDAQQRDLDWGEGRDVKLVWRPGAGVWQVAASLRYGRTNGFTDVGHSEPTDPVCAFGGPIAYWCGKYGSPYLELGKGFSKVNRADAAIADGEEHSLIDFTVGRDVGLGALMSTVSVGMRYANLQSTTRAEMKGIPDWVLAEGFMSEINPYGAANNIHHLYNTNTDAQREFEGWGPTLTWDAALKLVDVGDAGQVDLDWTLGAGVLFGDQRTDITGEQTGWYVAANAFQLVFAGLVVPPTPMALNGPPVDIHRKQSTTAPTVNAAFGLSYDIGRLKLGAGYRWERYFDVLDVGYDEAKEADRTIDGPYFKIAVGFGG